MIHPIFLVGEGGVGMEPVPASTFSEIGVKERKDLQAWVLDLPQLLQEDLLVVSSEFDHFSTSDRRLDVLALDRSGLLVVVELKRELHGSFADQQAIRYAAFCSTMTMAELVAEMAIYHKWTQDEARAKILAFLGTDELPELVGQPRIILAGSSLDDQELTSTVLWLRRFGIDITCIELVPYRLPGSGRIAIVPRTIIPLPEAKDYLVRAQTKEQVISKQQDAWSTNGPIWEAVASAFNLLEPRLFSAKRAGQNRIMQVRTGIGNIHYEWLKGRTTSFIQVAIHFEDGDRQVNMDRLGWLTPLLAELETEAGRPFVCEPWGDKWARGEFRVDVDDPAAPQIAAELMNILINKTWPVITSHLQSSKA